MKTFANLAALYLQDYARPSKRLSSVAEDERVLNRHLLPALGRIDLEAIDRSHCYKIKAAKGAACSGLQSQSLASRQ